MNKSGNSNKLRKRIIGFMLAVFLVLTMTGCSFREEETDPLETDPVTTTTAPQEEPSSDPPVSTTENIEEIITYDDVSHEQLMANLDENTKRFDPDLQAYVKEVVSIAYQNAGELAAVCIRWARPTKRSY